MPQATRPFRAQSGKDSTRERQRANTRHRRRGIGTSAAPGTTFSSWWGCAAARRAPQGCSSDLWESLRPLSPPFDLVASCGSAGGLHVAASVTSGPSICSNDCREASSAFCRALRAACRKHALTWADVGIGTLGGRQAPPPEAGSADGTARAQVRVRSSAAVPAAEHAQGGGEGGGECGGLALRAVG